MTTLESFTDPTEQKKDTRTKRERLGEIFALIEEAPAVSSSQSAYDLVHESFRTIEGVSIEDNESIGDKMVVVPFVDMILIPGLNGVRFFIYDKHVMFISENGAIDIRLIDPVKKVTLALLLRNPSYPKDHMKLIFAKNGSDGKGVWT
jgi:hypothetical protein